MGFSATSTLRSNQCANKFSPRNPFNNWPDKFVKLWFFPCSLLGDSFFIHMRQLNRFVFTLRSSSFVFLPTNTWVLLLYSHCHIINPIFFTFYKVHWSTFEALKCNEIKNYERKLQSGVCHDCTVARRRKSWMFIYFYLFNKSDSRNINECYCLLHLLSPNRSTNKMKKNWLCLTRKMK